MVKCRHTDCDKSASRDSVYCEHCVQLPVDKCNLCNKVEHSSQVPGLIGKVIVRGLVSFIVSSVLTFTYLFAAWSLNFALDLGWILPPSEEILTRNLHLFLWIFGIWMVMNIFNVDPFGLDDMNEMR